MFLIFKSMWEILKKVLVSLIFKWETLKKIQNIQIVKSTYTWIFIVPIFAQSFAKIKQITTIKVFDQTFEVNLSLPFSWQIFYFSGLFFVIANIFYYIACPEIIKDFSNFNDFISVKKGANQIIDYFIEDKNLDFNLPNLMLLREVVGRESIDSNIDNFIPLEKCGLIQLSNPSIPLMKYKDNSFAVYSNIFYNMFSSGYFDYKIIYREDNLQEIFGIFFQEYNVSKLFWRVLCTVFYCLGFIFIGYIFIQSFRTVLEIIF